MSELPSESVSVCIECGQEIREQVLKSGPCWVRGGTVGARTICEPSPDYHHHPDLGPESGHTFRLSVESRGSYGIVGVEGHTDSKDFMGPTLTLDVRAWSLPEALRRAAARPLAAWFQPDESAPEVNRD